MIYPDMQQIDFCRSNHQTVSYRIPHTSYLIPHTSYFMFHVASCMFYISCCMLYIAYHILYLMFYISYSISHVLYLIFNNSHFIPLNLYLYSLYIPYFPPHNLSRYATKPLQLPTGQIPQLPIPTPQTPHSKPPTPNSNSQLTLLPYLTFYLSQLAQSHLTPHTSHLPSHQSTAHHPYQTKT
jgi:hypothetical protein